MDRYDGGYGRGRGPSWADPYGGGPSPARGRDQGERPWVGGYREGYQGGSGGYRTSGHNGGGYGGDYGRGRGSRYGGEYGTRGQQPRRYGGDYWWLGERAFPQPASYDDAYRDFDREHHPRISPVGGMYHAMGGEYGYRRPPRPLREETWFSDWTRWF